jgi:hypothetical protein
MPANSSTCPFHVSVPSGSLAQLGGIRKGRPSLARLQAGPARQFQEVARKTSNGGGRPIRFNMPAGGHRFAESTGRPPLTVGCRGISGDGLCRTLVCNVDLSRWHTTENQPSSWRLAASGKASRQPHGVTELMVSFGSALSVCVAHPRGSVRAYGAGWCALEGLCLLRMSARAAGLRVA